VLKAWIDNFLKPGNLAGGFANYPAAHAGRVAIMREQAPVLPPLGFRPACAGQSTTRCASEDKIGSSNQIRWLQAVAEGGASWFSGTIPQVISS